MGVQSEHEATFDDNEYLPAEQGMHVIAPAFDPVFVMAPAAQSGHDESPGFP